MEEMAMRSLAAIFLPRRPVWPVNFVVMRDMAILLIARIEGLLKRL
jgi:hypothetical protein